MSTHTDTLAEYAAVIRERSRDRGRLLVERWFVGLLLIGGLVQGLSIWRVFHGLTPDTRPPLKDSLIFEYIGWYLWEGGRLYVDVWEIKPPLAFESTAVLAALSGGDVRLYHGLAVVVTNLAAIGCVLVVGMLVHELTDDPGASFASGLALYALPAFHWRAAFGFKVKYFVVLFGLVSIYLHLRRRPFAAGVAASAAVGFWQLGAVFPLLGLGLAAQRRESGYGARTVEGIASASAVIVAPVVYWGATEAMIVETVFAPLLVAEGAPVVAHARRAAWMFGAILPIVIIGLYGVGSSLANTRRSRSWWLVPGTAWFGVQVLALDLDAFPDLFPLLAFVALGLGMALASMGRHRAVTAAVLALVVLNLVTLGGVGAGARLGVPAPEPVPEADAVDLPYNMTERRALLWRTVPTATCRPFFGPTQHRLIARTGGRYADTTCGEFDPAWAAVRSQLRDHLR